MIYGKNEIKDQEEKTPFRTKGNSEWNGLEKIKKATS